MNNFKNEVILYFELNEKAYNPRSWFFFLCVFGQGGKFFYKINHIFDIRKLDNQKEYFKVIGSGRKHLNNALIENGESSIQQYLEDKKIISFSLDDFNSVADIKEKIIDKLLEKLDFKDWTDSICVGKTTGAGKDIKPKPLLLHKKFIEELKVAIKTVPVSKEEKLFNKLFEKRLLEESLFKKRFLQQFL